MQLAFGMHELLVESEKMLPSMQTQSPSLLSESVAGHVLTLHTGSATRPLTTVCETISFVFTARQAAADRQTLPLRSSTLVGSTVFVSTLLKMHELRVLSVRPTPTPRSSRGAALAEEAKRAPKARKAEEARILGRSLRKMR